MLRGQNYEFLTLYQTADAVFPSTSDAIRDPLTSDTDPSSDDDGKFQGTIQFPPLQNDAYSGTIREELDCLVESATLNELNLEKVIQSVVVDTSRISYNNGIFF